MECEPFQKFGKIIAIVIGSLTGVIAGTILVYKKRRYVIRDGHMFCGSLRAVAVMRYFFSKLFPTMK